MKVFYSVDEVCELSVYEMSAAGDSFDKYVAEECAQDYHDNHDGWELQSWPYTFSLRETEDGPVGARFAVDREAVPSFTALALKAAREGREGSGDFVRCLKAAFFDYAAFRTLGAAPAGVNRSQVAKTR